MRIYLVFASLFGLTAVVLGAMGAHWLKPRISEVALDQFEKGVTYQLFHTLVLLFLFSGNHLLKDPWRKWSATAFTAGILLFSGSLYLLSTRELSGWYAITAIAGPATPLGGMGFIAGWLFLLISLFQSEKRS